MEFRYNGQVLGGTTALSQGLTTYSEEETLIGTYLGKPLYRKVIKGTIPDTAWGGKYRLFASGISNNTIETVTSLRVRWIVGKGEVSAPNYVMSNQHAGVWYDDGNDAIGIVVGSEWATGAEGIGEIEYTKATDPEGTVTPLPANYVHDYTTDDGWHVRKYSDGYVEQTYSALITDPTWATVRDVRYTSVFNTDADGALPIPLVKYISFSGSALATVGGFGMSLMASEERVSILTHAPSPFVVATESSYSDAYRVNFTVVGRWK